MGARVGDGGVGGRVDMRGLRESWLRERWERWEGGRVWLRDVRDGDWDLNRGRASYGIVHCGFDGGIRARI